MFFLFSVSSSWGLIIVLWYLGHFDFWVLRHQLFWQMLDSSHDLRAKYSGGYISVQNGIFVDKPSMPEWYYIALPVLSSSTSTLDTSHLQVIPSLINMACFGFACYWLNRKIFQCTPRFCIQPWSSQARHSQPNFGQSDNDIYSLLYTFFFAHFHLNISWSLHLYCIQNNINKQPRVAVTHKCSAHLLVSRAWTVFSFYWTNIFLSVSIWVDRPTCLQNMWFGFLNFVTIIIIILLLQVCVVVVSKKVASVHDIPAVNLMVG